MAALPKRNELPRLAGRTRPASGGTNAPAASARTLKSRRAAPAPVSRPVTTVRLDESILRGLKILEAHSGVKRPLNKWVNLALEEMIRNRAAAVEDELKQALGNIRAYRKSDPGYKRAIKAFIDAEVEFAGEDPMEGSREPAVSGPALSRVRELLRD
jgi:hypothetical protein